MLSDGQREVRKIVNFFLEEYENLPSNNDDLDKKVRDAFCSNDIIKNDPVTSQQLGTSSYSENYLLWLRKNGVEEEIESDSDGYFSVIDFSMKEMIYKRVDNLEPAYYKGGKKWDSTISCLFGLAQGKRLDSDSWDSIYYDAIQLWEVNNGGNHRLLAHILFGSKNVNPHRLTIIRNDLVDPLLNESLYQFDKLFDRINFNNFNKKHHIQFAFDVNSLSEKSMTRIKNFFCDITDDEKTKLIRCIKAIKKFPHKYISRNLGKNEIDIDNMYHLLNDIRILNSKPSWYRELLIYKQKLLGIDTVDDVTISVFQLATWDKPYFDKDDLNNEGLLCYFLGLRELLLALFNRIK